MVNEIFGKPKYSFACFVRLLLEFAKTDRFFESLLAEPLIRNTKLGKSSHEEPRWNFKKHFYEKFRKTPGRVRYRTHVVASAEAPVVQKKNSGLEVDGFRITETLAGTLEKRIYCFFD